MKAFGIVVSARMQWNCCLAGLFFDYGRVHIVIGPLSVTIRRRYRSY